MAEVGVVEVEAALEGAIIGKEAGRVEATAVVDRVDPTGAAATEVVAAAMEAGVAGTEVAAVATAEEDMEVVVAATLVVALGRESFLRRRANAAQGFSMIGDMRH